MASIKPETWRPLPLPTSSGLPILLVSMDTGASSYVVSISDMANIWVESLDRKAICMRGWSENTSIDPSDTAENMTRFLSCLKTALDPTQDDHHTTSLTLSPSAESDAGEDGLTIKITCRLPGFGALRWPMHLKKQPPSAVATELVLPLIQTQSDKMQEVASLMQIIKHKDAVITKLSDKLEAMGAGLEHIFTALSGRKKVTRAAAESRVKGLGYFNEKQWKNELDSDSQRPGIVKELIQSVFGEKGLEFRSNLELEQSPGLDKWWHNFQPTTQGSHHKQTKAPLSKSSSPPPPAKSTSCEDEDDFQIQSTPPHLKSTKEASRTTERFHTPDMTVDDEGDSLIPDSNLPPALPDRRRQPETKTTSSRLGAIGGKKQPAQPRSPSPLPDKRTEKLPQNVDDEETASEASDENDVTASLPDSSPTSPPPKRAENHTPKKMGLGVIQGGPVKAHSPSRDSEKTTPKKPAHQHLGTITGKQPKLVEQDGNESRGRTMQDKEKGVAEEKPRETSKERADRKREELKRELEKKAAAGPAKKKRRF